jgi:hypothetical protein
MSRDERLDERAGPVDLQAYLLAREPSPEEAAVIADELAMLLERLRQPVRQMTEMCLQGYSVGEIAAATRRHPITVRRNLKGVKQYLRQRCTTQGP